jgi:hypothetical protein
MKYSFSYSVRMPSKYGCIKAFFAVSLSSGSIYKSPFINSSPSFESLPAYFFSIVSGFVTSGNLNPTYLGFFANYSC